MRRALELAATPGVPLGPNPRVGCVLLDDGGATVAEGYHRGAGSPHAEADALAPGRGAGPRHDRRRHPRAVQPHRPHRPVRAARCVEAGVRRVVFAQADPNPVAAGGARAAARGRHRGRAAGCWPTRPGR